MKWLILLCVLVAVYHAWSEEQSTPVLPCHQKRKQYAYRQYNTLRNGLPPKVDNNKGDDASVANWDLGIRNGHGGWERHSGWDGMGSTIMSGVRQDKSVGWQERSGLAQDRSAADYTGQYAELASPVPSHVNLDELVESLRAASNHPE